MDLGVVPRVTPCTFTVDRHRRVHVDLGHDGICSFFASRWAFPAWGRCWQRRVVGRGRGVLERPTAPRRAWWARASTAERSASMDADRRDVDPLLLVLHLRLLEDGRREVRL